MQEYGTNGNGCIYYVCNQGYERTEDPIVYKIEADTVNLIQCGSHYKDK